MTKAIMKMNKKMKKIKKLLTSGLAVLLMLCSIVFSGCSDKKYQVSQEEYEKAFTKEMLSNVTFYVTPWLHDNGKEYYYYVDNGFAIFRYYNDLQYFGLLYGVKSGEKICYLYGSEYLENYTENDAFWRKSDSSLIDEIEISYLPNAEFVSQHKKPYEVLKFNKRKKCYYYEFQDKSTVFSYYFEEKILKKIEMSSNSNKWYNCTYVFSNYGTTTIPIEIKSFQ